MAEDSSSKKRSMRKSILIDTEIVRNSFSVNVDKNSSNFNEEDKDCISSSSRCSITGFFASAPKIILKAIESSQKSVLKGRMNNSRCKESSIGPSWAYEFRPTLEDEFNQLAQTSLNEKDSHEQRKLRVKRSSAYRDPDSSSPSPSLLSLSKKRLVPKKDTFSPPLITNSRPIQSNINKRQNLNTDQPKLKRIRLIAKTPEGYDNHSKSFQKRRLEYNHLFLLGLHRFGELAEVTQKRNSLGISNGHIEHIYTHYKESNFPKNAKDTKLKSLYSQGNEFWKSYRNALTELHHLELKQSLLHYNPHENININTVFSDMETKEFSTLQSSLDDFAKFMQIADLLQAKPKLDIILKDYFLLEEDAIGIQEYIDSVSKMAKFLGQHYHVKLFSNLSGLTMNDLKAPVEPVSKKNHQVYLLEEASQVHRFIHDSKKHKIQSSKKIAKAIMKFWETRHNAEERRLKGEERRVKKLAKLVSNEVKKQWKMVREILKARYNIYLKDLQKKAGERNLDAILEHSSKVLGFIDSDDDFIETNAADETDRINEELLKASPVANILLSNDNDEIMTQEDDDEGFFYEGEDEYADGEKGEFLSWMDKLDSDMNTVAKGEHEPNTNTLDPDSDPSPNTEKNATHSMAESETNDGMEVDNVIAPEEETEFLIHDSSFSSVGDSKVPFLLKHSLRPYQYDGMKWLIDLNNGDRNGILADEMGLGKTIQTIALLAYLACEGISWGPHLIIVPTSVLLNWEYELKKWCPGFKVLTYYGNQKERQMKRQGWSKPNSFNVCITSYQLALQDANMFKRKSWSYLILDEAHNIKNFKSQRWQTLLTFASDHRLLITGTPLQNSLMELWSLLYFLMPSGPTMKEFQDWFSSSINQAVEAKDQRNMETVQKLHTVLRPYILRRMKSQVEKQMPAKIEHVVFCRLSTRQRLLYDDFMSRAKTKEAFASGNYMSILNCLMQLRKVCNHPDMFEQRPIVTGFKMSSEILHEPLRCVAQIYKLRNSKVDMSLGVFDIWHFQDTIIDLDWAIHDNIGSQEMQNYDILDGKRMASFLETQTNMAISKRWQYVKLFNSKFKNLRPKSNLLSPANLLIFVKSFKPETSLQAELGELHHKAIVMMSRHFTFLTPKVIVSDPSIIMNPPTALSKDFMALQTEEAYNRLMKKQEIFFPDKSLLQYDCGKLQTLDRLLKDLMKGKHRVLLFTQMTKMLDIFESFLNIHGYRYIRLDGSTKIEDRQILMDRFNNDDRIFVFILSTRSGGVGMNLTGADTVIFYDSDWNPAMDAQAQDRAHRIGQTRDVHIYRLISSHTIEENMLKKAQHKRALDSLVIQNADFTTDFVLQKSDWRDWMNTELTKVSFDTSDANGLQDVLAEAEDEVDRVALRNAQSEIQNEWIDFKEMDVLPFNPKFESESTLNDKIVEEGHIEDYMFNTAMLDMGVHNLFPLSDFQ